VGEELTLFRPTFNRSIRIEARPERLTTDPGAVLLRDIMERLVHCKLACQKDHRSTSS